MFSSYPRSKEAEQDPDAYFAMVELGCDGLSDEAIQEAIKDVAQCKVKGVTPGFCPQHDIFTGHAAQINERNKLVARRLARPEIERPRRSFNAEYVHPATGRRTELIRAGYAVIAKDVSLEAARKAGAYPEGTVWLTTGEVLAPPAKQQKDAA
tara:strand:- start:5445 stop:5903 length:459 start_codon:yes stop_codon:yes gene_type:complete